METVLVIDGKVVRTLQRQYIGAAWKHLKIGVYEPILQNYTNIRIFLNLKKLGNSFFFFFLILISSAHFFISCVKFLSDMR